MSDHAESTEISVDSQAESVQSLEADLKNDPAIAKLWDDDGKKRDADNKLTFEGDKMLQDIADNPIEENALPEGAEEVDIEISEVDDGEEKPEELNDLDDVDAEVNEEDEQERAESDGDEVKEPAKTVSFHSGDDEFQIPEDAVFTIPVDGEPTEVSLKEALSGISGQKAIAQRFTALDKVKKEVEAKETLINHTIGQASKLLEEGKGVEATAHIIGQAGLNTEQVFVSLFEQLAPHFEQYSKLTPEQKRLYEDRLHSYAQQAQAQRAIQEAEYLKMEKDVSQRMSNVQQTLNLDNAQIVELYDQFKEEMANGEFKEQEITPELLAQYYTLVQKEDRVKRALSSVNSDLASNRFRVNEVMARVNAELARGKPLGQVDVEGIVSEIYGVTVAKNQPKQRPAKAAKKTPEQGKSKSARKNWLDRMVEDFEASSNDKELQNKLNKWRS